MIHHPLKKSFFFALIIAFCNYALLLPNIFAQSQSAPVIQPKPFQSPLPPPEYLPDSPERQFTLPPLPESREKPPSPNSGPSFLLTGIELEGNSVFSDDVLKQSVSSFFNSQVTLADLEEIRYRLTRYYVDQGYINSGALIKPGQRVTHGIVTYLIIEGRLNRIDVTGQGNLRPAYIRQRIWPDADIPFNTPQLQETFQMLLQNPLIERMDGRIVPGLKPGEATLALDVTRDKPYDIRFTVDNHASPNLGAETVSLNSTFRNITGFGDALSLNTGLTEGTDELDLGFSIPLSSKETLLSLSYSYGNNDLIADSLKSLGINSKIDSLALSLSHPFYRTLQRDVTMSLSLKKEESRSFITHSVPFAFSEGAVDGRSRATVLGISQSFQDRTANQVVAMRSTFNIGVDLFDPTIHSESLPDGRFLYWLGQIQYGRRLGEMWGQLVFSGDIQIADDRLPSMEQFSAGGANSVRGYRENQHIGDNGYRASLEWRMPIWSKDSIDHMSSASLQLVPFMDVGSAWDRDHWGKTETAKDNFLFSVGMGILWSGKWVDASLFYGYAVEDVEEPEDYDLQDDGIHFKVTCRWP